MYSKRCTTKTYTGLQMQNFADVQDAPESYKCNLSTKLWTPRNDNGDYIRVYFLQHLVNSYNHWR